MVVCHIKRQKKLNDKKKVLHLAWHRTIDLVCILIHLHYSTGPKKKITIWSENILIILFARRMVGNSVWTAMSCCVTPGPGRSSPGNESEWQRLQCFCLKAERKGEWWAQLAIIRWLFMWFSVSAGGTVCLTLKLI